MNTSLFEHEIITEMNSQTKNRYKIMRKFVGNSKEKIILDLGAGPNPLSKNALAKKILIHDINNSFTNSPDIIVDLNKKNFPLKNNSVDIIIAGEFIEHLLNPLKFIRECYRILKKGGFMVLPTPNICSFKNRLRVLFGLMPEHCARANEEGIDTPQTHIKDFNLSFLKYLLEKGGFVINKIGTNGIVFRNKIIFPLFLTPTIFGEILIIKAIKNEK
jgi:SAM-dependent methyltransferase